MGRMYVASGSLAGFTGPGDIVELTAPATGIVVVHSFSITQSSSETDDSTKIQLARVGTSGSGGGSPAPVAEALEAGMPAFSGSLEENNATQATGNTVLWNWGWSALAGLNIIWTPETRPIVSPSAGLVWLSTVALTALDLEWEVVFEEIG